MKLRLNMPLLDLVYCLKVTHSTVTQIFFFLASGYGHKAISLTFMAMQLSMEEMQGAIVEDNATMFYVFLWKKRSPW